jgi:hypothetical protein
MRAIVTESEPGGNVLTLSADNSAEIYELGLLSYQLKLVGITAKPVCPGCSEPTITGLDIYLNRET